LLRKRGLLRPLPIRAQPERATMALQRQRSPEPALRRPPPEIHPSSG
jgi:hypothetical protein